MGTAFVALCVVLLGAAAVMARGVPTAAPAAQAVVPAAAAAPAAPATTAQPPPRANKKAARKAAVPKSAAAAKVNGGAVAVNDKKKTEVIDYIRANYKKLSAGTIQKLKYVLDGQMVMSFDDLIKLGKAGALAIRGIPDDIRKDFVEIIVKEIGIRGGHDDQRPVWVPPYKPPKKVDDCAEQAFSDPNIYLEMAPNAKVGDWLRATYPEISAPKMTRAIKALARQTVVTWADLHRVGLNGVEALLHVPDGLREKLREAIIFNIGHAGKHDDGRFEPYSEPKKPKPAPRARRCRRS